MTTASPSPSPDGHALNIAHAVQQAVAPDTVLLFGSRATGKHRADSDVDILIIRPDPPQSAAAGAQRAAAAYMDEHPPRLEVNIVTMTLAEFQRCRRAKQHLAGQADHYGIVMNGANLHYAAAGADDRYPEHWPATRQRLENAAEWRQEYNDMVAGEHWNQKLMGLTAQQTVENALRGLLSAHNDPALFRHDLNRIWEHYLANHHNPADPNAAPLYAAVTRLLDHTTYESGEPPGGYRNWLTQYAVDYRYHRTPRPMNRSEQLELHELVNHAVQGLIDRIHQLSGASDADLFPDSIPWEL